MKIATSASLMPAVDVRFRAPAHRTLIRLLVDLLLDSLNGKSLKDIPDMRIARMAILAPVGPHHGSIHEKSARYAPRQVDRHPVDAAATTNVVDPVLGFLPTEIKPLETITFPNLPLRKNVGLASREKWVGGRNVKCRKVCLFHHGS
jgi:hypothetical protein